MVGRPALGHGLSMTTMTTIHDEAAEALAPASRHAHHDPDAAEAVTQRAADVVASVAALRSATAVRGYAAAIPSTLDHLDAAAGHLAAIADELRVETLWHLRDTEPAATDDDHVDAYARDFSTLAGRLYAAQQATVALRERVERQPSRLGVTRQVGSRPLGRHARAGGRGHLRGRSGSAGTGEGHSAPTRRCIPRAPRSPGQRAVVDAGRAGRITGRMRSEAGRDHAAPQPREVADRHAEIARRHTARLRAMRPWSRDAGGTHGQSADLSDQGPAAPSTLAWPQTMWGLVKHTFLESWHRGQETAHAS
jgi:hypothetical protein